MAYGIELRSDAVRSLAFGSIGATYANVGTALEYPTRVLIVQNTTDVLLMLSFAGGVDHIPFPSGAIMILDVSSDRVTDGGYFISKKTQLQVKYVSGAPSSGTFYVTAMHAKGD